MAGQGSVAWQFEQLELESGNRDALPEPEVIAAEIVGHLQAAMEEMEALQELLEGEEATA